VVLVQNLFLSPARATTTSLPPTAQQQRTRHHRRTDARARRRKGVAKTKWRQRRRRHHRRWPARHHPRLSTKTTYPSPPSQACTHPPPTPLPRAACAPCATPSPRASPTWPSASGGLLKPPLPPSPPSPRSAPQAFSPRPTCGASTPTPRSHRAFPWDCPASTRLYVAGYLLAW